jgi:hypothetical protein
VGPRIELWPLDRIVECAHNPRQNDGAVDSMLAEKLRILRSGDTITCAEP